MSSAFSGLNPELIASNLSREQEAKLSEVVAKLRRLSVEHERGEHEEEVEFQLKWTLGPEPAGSSGNDLSV